MKRIWVGAGLLAAAMMGRASAQASPSGSGGQQGATGASQAPPQHTMGQHPQGQQPAAHQVTGRVKSIDHNREMLTLQSGKRIKLSPTADIIKFGSPVSLNLIQPGDKVRASFQPGSSTTAQRLEVLHAAGTGGPQR